MDQRLIERIIFELYRRLCGGTLLIVAPELPWGVDGLCRLLQAVEALGWRTSLSLGPGLEPPEGRCQSPGGPEGGTGPQKLWVPAMPLTVLSRLAEAKPQTRQEAVVLEALLKGIPVGALEGSWLPPGSENQSRGSGDLGQRVLGYRNQLADWGLEWVSFDRLPAWLLGVPSLGREGRWEERVLHGAAVRSLDADIRVLRVKKDAVITAAARDELSRRRIELIGDR